MASLQPAAVEFLPFGILIHSEPSNSAHRIRPPLRLYLANGLSANRNDVESRSCDRRQQVNRPDSENQWY